MGEKKIGLGMKPTFQLREGRYLLQEEQEKVEEGLIQAVINTTRTRPMPSGNMTKGELERRMEVTIEIWNHCHGELGWSWRRTLDHVESFLTKVIDGAREYDAMPDLIKGIETEKSVMWGAQQLREIEAERRLSALAACDVGDTVCNEKTEDRILYVPDETVED